MLMKHLECKARESNAKIYFQKLLIKLFPLFFSPSTAVVLNAKIIKRAMRFLKNANVQLVLQDHNVKLVMMLFLEYFIY